MNKYFWFYSKVHVQYIYKQSKQNTKRIENWKVHINHFIMEV